MSLLRLLRDSTIAVCIDDTFRGEIARVLYGYVMTGPIAVETPERARFAFEGDGVPIVYDHWVRLIPEDHWDDFERLLKLRREVLDNSGLSERLLRLGSSPVADQLLLLLVLKWGVFCDTRYDDSLVEWLSQTDTAVKCLCELPDACIMHLLEILLEFQQRHRGDWSSRLPHLLALATDEAGNEIRVRLLCAYVIVLSLNTGIVSPIQRVMASRQRAVCGEVITSWRDGMAEVATVSEPWIAARVRSISASISRLVGPIDYERRHSELQVATSEE
jgi:hypothetical protein